MLLDRKINQIYFYTISIYLFVLFFCLLFFNWKLPIGSLVFLQLGLILSSFLLYRVCINADISTIKKIIFFYQGFWVIYSYFFYINVYGTPLGYMAADAYVYNQYAEIGQRMNIGEYIAYIELSKGFNYSDWGFFIFVKYVYALPGDGFLIMKIINIIFSYFTSILIYRISFWTTNQSVSKMVLILFGLNPIIIFFAASGLKEPTFLFVIIAAFYFVYKYLLTTKISNLLLGAFFALLMIFFRPLLFIFFISGWVLYFFFSSKGQNKFIYQVLVVVFFLIVALIIYRMLQDEIQYYLNLDIEAMGQERLESATGAIEGTQFSLVNRFIGFFGPFPTILQLGGKDIEILQSVGILFKAALSVFNLYFFYWVIVSRNKLFYPVAVFIFLTILMMVFTSSSFDMRFHYTYMPLFILASVIGADQMIRAKRAWLASAYWVGLFLVILIWNQR